jgi:hypothetical protein
MMQHFLNRQRKCRMKVRESEHNTLHPGRGQFLANGERSFVTGTRALFTIGDNR